MMGLLFFILNISDTSGVPVYRDIPSPAIIGTSLLTTGFRAIGALVIVLAIMLLFVWVLRKFRVMPFGGRYGQIIKVLGKSVLNTKQAIYIVEVPNRILILGVSGETINVLTEIKEPSLIESIKQSTKGGIFSQYLHGFTSKIFPSRGNSGPQDAVQQHNYKGGLPQIKEVISPQRNTSGLWE